MDSMLATKQDLRSLEQKIEDHFRRIELNQSLEFHKRSVNFWFGLMFFGGLGIMLALIRPWA